MIHCPTYCGSETMKDVAPQTPAGHPNPVIPARAVNSMCPIITNLLQRTHDNIAEYIKKGGGRFSPENPNSHVLGSGRPLIG